MNRLVKVRGFDDEVDGSGCVDGEIDDSPDNVTFNDCSLGFSCE